MNVSALPSLLGLCILVAVICLLLRQYRPEFALTVTLVASAILLGIIIVALSPAFDEVRAALNGVGAASPYLTVLFKSLGICYLSQFAMDACRDADANSLAGKVELLGKASMILTALPLFRGVLELITGLVGK